MGQQGRCRRRIAGIGWIRRKRWPERGKKAGRHLTLVDLFCGCGGLTLGVCEAARSFERGVDIRLAVDSARQPLAVYKRNFGCDQGATVLAQVEKVFDGKLGGPLSLNERVYKRRTSRLDLLVAGPPCQGHSDLNNSTRRDDPRNRLYLRVARAAEVLSPAVVVVENVPTVVHDRNRVVDAAKDAFYALGYHVTDAVVRFVKLGVPQLRKRHILLATRGGKVSLKQVFDSLPDRRLTVGDFIDGLQDEPERRKGLFFQPSQMSAENLVRVRYLFKENLYDLPNELRPSCHRNGHRYPSMYGRMQWAEPAQTITSGFGSMGQGRFVHPTKPRTITPHEAARLQGFPDFFDFHSVNHVTALREMIGNAVPPQLTATLVPELIRQELL